MKKIKNFTSHIKTEKGTSQGRNPIKSTMNKSKRDHIKNTEDKAREDNG